MEKLETSGSSMYCCRRKLFSTISLNKFLLNPYQKFTIENVCIYKKKKNIYIIFSFLTVEYYQSLTTYYPV